jgi:hypothetical protein
MNHSLTVGVVQRAGHGAGYIERFLQRELGLTLQPLPQRLAFHVGHDIEEPALDGTGVVEWEDMRMGESGGNLDLSEEALVTEHVAQLGVEQLQGDSPIELEIPGKVHCGHTAAAQLAFDGVAVPEGFNDTGRWGSHP